VFPSTPFDVAFETIGSCNLSCTYCYAKPFDGGLPSQSDLEFLFRKTQKEAAPFKATIEGGEPFLRKDIIDLLLIAKDTLANVGVVTNGTFLSKLSIEQLKGLKAFCDGVPCIQVSLDSINQSVNDSTRGLTSQTISGLNILDESGIPFSIGMVLTRLNNNDVPNTVKSLVSRYRHLRHVHLMSVMPAQELGSGWLSLRLGRESLIATAEAVTNSLQSLDSDVTLTEPYGRECDFGDTMLDHMGLNSCTAGILRAVVLTNGDVIPCEMTRNVRVGNLYVQSWAEIWSHSVGQRMTSRMDGGLCFSTNLPRNADSIRTEIP